VSESYRVNVISITDLQLQLVATVELKHKHNCYNTKSRTTLIHSESDIFHVHCTHSDGGLSYSSICIVTDTDSDSHTHRDTDSEYTNTHTA